MRPRDRFLPRPMTLIRNSLAPSGYELPSVQVITCLTTARNAKNASLHPTSCLVFVA